MDTGLTEQNRTELENLRGLAMQSKSPIPLPRLGEVLEMITPHQKGWIKFEGSYWSASFYKPELIETIAPGEKVTVLGREGNTLLVMPIGYVEPVEPCYQRHWWQRFKIG